MFDVSGYHILLAAFGGAIILAHWLPRFFSNREPAASALLIGFGLLVFGGVPHMPAAIDPIALPKPWEVVSELTVTIGLFGVGIRIDRLKSRKLWMPTVCLLAIAMPLTILGVAVVGWITGMTVAGALLLAAVLAPTDPVLAGDVQVGPPLEGGEHPVRFTLTTEAGINDGLAFPFVYLALAIASAGAVSGELLSDWFWRDVLYRIVLGMTSGAGLGWLLGKLMFSWPRDNTLAKTRAGVVAVAGVFVTYGLTEMVEGYGFIAVFVAGLVIRRAEAQHQFHSRLHAFTESIEHALTAVLLVGLGAAIPALLPSLDWHGVALGVVLIFVLRPCTAWFALARIMPKSRQRAVVSFYGVRGIGSIYYLSYAGSHMDLINEAELWATVVFTITLSTMVHGFTAGLALEHATKEE